MNTKIYYIVIFFILLKFVCNSDDFNDIKNNYEQSFKDLMISIYQNDKDLSLKFSDYIQNYRIYIKMKDIRQDFILNSSYYFKDISARKLKVVTLNGKNKIIVFGLNKVEMYEFSNNKFVKSSMKLEFSSVIDLEFFDIDEDNKDECIILTDSTIKVYTITNNKLKFSWKQENQWNLKQINKLKLPDEKFFWLTGLKRKENLFDVFLYVSQFHWLYPGLNEKQQLLNITPYGNSYKTYSKLSSLIVLNENERKNAKISFFTKERVDFDKKFEKKFDKCNGIVAEDILKRGDGIFFTLATFSGIEQWKRLNTGSFKKIRKLYRIFGVLDMVALHEEKDLYFVLCSSGELRILSEKDY